MKVLPTCGAQCSPSLLCLLIRVVEDRPAPDLDELRGQLPVRRRLLAASAEEHDPSGELGPLQLSLDVLTASVYREQLRWWD